MSSSENSDEDDGGVNIRNETSSDEGSRKRKRDTTQTSELEIDVSLPEPPSKKALRKAKRERSSSTSKKLPTEEDVEPSAVDGANLSPNGDQQEPNATKAAASTKPTPSPYCVWIGNLPFTATKAILRTFLTSDTSNDSPSIPDAAITRIHIPAPVKASTKGSLKPQNKGFAYVDLATETAFNTALALSESSLGGRRLLIKSAKDFTGRPEKSSTDGGPNGSTAAAFADHSETKSKKPPMRRVFVGNLGFDVTREDLQSHFAVCGGVDDIFMATFEDTGKCKGFAWVTFETVEGASDAVKGWTYVQPQDDHLDESDESEGDGDGNNSNDDNENGKAALKKLEKPPKKKPKPRKWFVNRLQGRTLRCEFAEDPETRYKKRFNKNAGSSAGRSSNRGNWSAPANNDTGYTEQAPIEEVDHEHQQPRRSRNSQIRPGAPSDPNMRRGRSNRDGNSMGDNKYGTGGIVRPKGTKITFD